MTKKSKARLLADQAAREAAGGRVKNLTQSRTITSTAWFGLKQTHKRSSDILVQLAGLLSQYSDPVVLMKVADNGDKDRFNQLHIDVQERMKGVSKEFSDLYDEHKDRNGACTTATEMQLAISLAERYQRFDISLMEKFQQIISDLNEIYNRAMRQLEEIRQQVETEQSKEPTDVEFREVPVNKTIQITQHQREYHIDLDANFRYVKGIKVTRNGEEGSVLPEDNDPILIADFNKHVLEEYPDMIEDVRRQNYSLVDFQLLGESGDMGAALINPTTMEINWFIQKTPAEPTEVSFRESPATEQPTA